MVPQDCSCYGVTQQYERKPYMRFTMPQTPYGFWVVGPRPYQKQASVGNQLFLTLSAFTPAVWALTVLAARARPEPRGPPPRSARARTPSRRRLVTSRRVAAGRC